MNEIELFFSDGREAITETIDRQSTLLSNEPVSTNSSSLRNTDISSIMYSESDGRKQGINVQFYHFVIVTVISIFSIRKWSTSLLGYIIGFVGSLQQPTKCSGKRKETIIYQNNTSNMHISCCNFFLTRWTDHERIQRQRRKMMKTSTDFSFSAP